MARKLPPSKPCQHIMDTGRPCGSPALRGYDFCYWHHRAHTAPFNASSSIPLLENGNAVQLALTEVARAAFVGKITAQQANALFYGLQISVLNLKNVNTQSNLERVGACTPAMDRILSPAPAFAENYVTVTESDPDPGCSIYIPVRENCEAVSPDSAETKLSKADTLVCAAAEATPAGEPAPEPADKTYVAESSGNQHRSSPEEIHNSIFHPDPAAVHAYWTQHLPPEVAELRCPSGELVYDPPKWLPLTPEQIEYLADRNPVDLRHATPEEMQIHERLVIHSSHRFIEPPQPDEIISMKKRLDYDDKYGWTNCVRGLLNGIDFDELEEAG